MRTRVGISALSLLWLLGLGLTGQEPEAKSVAARVVAAHTSGEARAILEATETKNLAAVAREVAAQAYQVAQRGEPEHGMWLAVLAEGAAQKSGDTEARGMCSYWHNVLLISGGDLEGALRGSIAAVAWADDTAAASGLHQVSCDALRQLGDHAGAIAECRQSLEKAAKMSAVRVGQAHNSLGLAYSLGGEYRLAFAEYQEALRIADAEKQNELLSSVKNNLGNLFAEQSDADLALRYYDESLAIKRAQGVKPRILSGLINLAGAANTLGRNDLARKALEEAFPLAEESGHKSLLSFCYYQRGRLDADEGNLDGAVGDLKRSLDGADPVDEPSRRIELGSVLLRKGDAEGALAQALAARDVAGQSEYPEALWRTESLLGRVYRKLSRPEEAQAAFRRAIAIIEDLRSNVAGVEEDRQRYLQDKLEPYRGLFELLAAAGRTDEAFTAAEQTKARVLAEVLGNGRLRITKGMTAAEREREETLRRRLVAARQSHLATRAETNRAAAEYAEFQTALYAAHPELALRRTAFDPPSAAAVAAQLDPGTAAVEYFLGSDAVFAMVIGAGDSTVHFYKLAASPKIVVEQAAAFRTALAMRALGFQTLARALYAELLEPLREIRGKKGIVLVPDGALWNLPFQAMQSANGKYTIENTAVSYAPSMTVLAALRRRANRKPTSSPSVLALGNPALSPASNLPLLPSAEKEVTDIGRLYGEAYSRVLTGARAAKSALNGNSVHYDVLHLATHGVLDPRQPMYSHLWLAPEGGDQGMLEAWEVMNLDLREEVVVLSACETARGAIGDGEGLLGMSWAMFVAGAPTTVASQWKVDAASTSALMTGFHRGLRESMMRRTPQFSKAEALRQATIETLGRAEFRHPFYWAAFVMLGDGS